MMQQTVAVCLVILFSLGVPKSGGSLYTGTADVCSIPECQCDRVRVRCACTHNSSFQDAFVFHDETRKLDQLWVNGCARLVFPPQALSAESHLVRIHISNIDHLEFQAESLGVTRLQFLNISSCTTLTIHQQAFRSYNQDSPTVTLLAKKIHQMNIKSKAFASIKNVTLVDIADLQLEPLAFKVKVPTLEPTISIRFINISTSAIASSVFSSSFRNIVLENCTIDKIQNNGFSGFIMNNITLRGVAINRIERSAFSDQSAIDFLHFDRCNISSFSQKSITAGISKFSLTNSVIQSLAKYGAIHATVATVALVNNTFRTLGEESLNFESWDSVRIVGNRIDFLEEGAINAIQRPIDKATAVFVFSDNVIGYANRMSLANQIPREVNVSLDQNRFSHSCDCMLDRYVKSVTGHSGLSSPFHDLTGLVANTSYCRLTDRDRPCFTTSLTLIQEYSVLFCSESGPPPCAVFIDPDAEDGGLAGGGGGGAEGGRFSSFYADFLLLFQVKTTKGILLFLLFCVVSSVVLLTICVGFLWIHRLLKRGRLVRDNLSGSFQFNSGEEKQMLYGSDQTTCNSLPEEEPQYAEIADIHPPPHDLEVTTLTHVSDITTLPKSTTTTLPSLTDVSTLPLRSNSGDAKETTSLLHQGHINRLSVSETSLTDEIMMALREKLNDPTLYCTVLDAAKARRGEEDLYCAPIYSDPNQAAGPGSPSSSS